MWDLAGKLLPKHNKSLLQFSVTLNSEQLDGTAIKVTSATKGFALGNMIPDVNPKALTDVAGNPLPEGTLPLAVDYADGMLTVNVIPGITAPGKTYKVTLTPDVNGAKAATLTVKTPKAGKTSAVTAKIKLSGSIDVIRPGNSITVTPSLTNFLGQPSETWLEFQSYDSKAKTWNDCDALFAVQRNENGTFSVTPGAGVIAGGKYRVRVAAGLPGCSEPVYSSYATMSVKMGSAKITADKKAVTLYIGDTNARTSVLLSSTDKTQNAISEVNVVTPKGYEDAFICDYNRETGKVTIAIANPTHKLLVKAKSVKLTLQVTLDGNITGKPNISIPVTATILK